MSALDFRNDIEKAPWRTLPRRSVTTHPSGRAVVDFHDVRRLIPGASSSTGTTLLLQELNETIFQFPEVRSLARVSRLPVPGHDPRPAS